MKDIQGLHKDHIKKTKYCKDCDKDIELKGFTKCSKNTDGLYHICKYCKQANVQVNESPKPSPSNKYKLHHNIINKMMRMKARGCSSKQIAANCNVGLTSVHTYTKNVTEIKKEEEANIKNNFKVRILKGECCNMDGYVIKRVASDDTIPYLLVRTEYRDVYVLEKWLQPLGV